MTIPERQLQALRAKDLSMLSLGGLVSNAVVGPGNIRTVLGNRLLRFYRGHYTLGAWIDEIVFDNTQNPTTATQPAPGTTPAGNQCVVFQSSATQPDPNADTLGTFSLVGTPIPTYAANIGFFLVFFGFKVGTDTGTTMRMWLENIGSGDGPGFNFDFLTPGKINVYSVIGDNNVADGNWHTAVGVGRPTSATASSNNLWVDGVQQTSQNVAAINGMGSFWTTQITEWGAHSDQKEGYDGSVCHVGFCYSRYAFTPEEIQLCHQATKYYIDGET